PPPPPPPPPPPFKPQTAYEIAQCLVGSEMCIRDSSSGTPLTRHFPSSVVRPAAGIAAAITASFR
ncbi:hypothetical protein, partial [Salmonella enterica]|uniref:hypothetical protein n=1 Tax=Salmonella enterica TaxID=28901 RepID=UPI002892C476